MSLANDGVSNYAVGVIFAPNLLRRALVWTKCSPLGKIYPNFILPYTYIGLRVLVGREQAATKKNTKHMYLIQ